MAVKRWGSCFLGVSLYRYSIPLPPAGSFFFHTGNLSFFFTSFVKVVGTIPRLRQSLGCYRCEACHSTLQPCAGTTEERALSVVSVTFEAHWLACRWSSSRITHHVEDDGDPSSYMGRTVLRPAEDSDLSFFLYGDCRLPDL